VNSDEVSAAAASEESLPPASIPAHLGWLQSRMALERTLLAWVRTSAALIGFGFAIFHFFEALNAMPGARPPLHPGSARLLGITLVGVGTLAEVLALLQYLFVVRYLEGPSFRGISSMPRLPRFRPGILAALVVTSIGAVTLWALWTRLP
jgi:putative membrane protein